MRVEKVFGNEGDGVQAALHVLPELLGKRLQSSAALFQRGVFIGRFLAENALYGQLPLR